ncbi:signal peptidase I [Litchfieldia alkalitelluris]|uniref:signal peptidase I n=1 Tax=Litchfieldia alkalitelluris TaxID=304268 RepID=UPI0009987EA4|nr:signal peptidase I [Litchfieldia alkalitelluris]
MVAEVFSWIKTIFVAVVFTIIVTTFFVQPYSVSGSSMEPTLQGIDPKDSSKVGDRVVVLKSAFLVGNEPSYEDMVIIDSRVDHERSWIDDMMDSPIVGTFTRDEQDSHVIWIKRVVGLAGDTLEFKDGHVYRNGEMLAEEYIKEEMNFPFEKVVVPEDSIFVMGDNRNYSSDSREIGPVPVDNVVGKVAFRMYPFNKIGTF